MNKYALCLTILVCSLFVSQPIECAEWGDLKIKFIVNGEPPAPQAFKVDKDEKICGNAPLLAPPLISDKGEIANVILFLQLDRRERLLIHESYKENKADKVTIKMEGCQFSPHTSFLQIGQNLCFENLGHVGHNPKIDLFRNPILSQVIPATPKTEIESSQFKHAETRACSISCSIHPWMSAWLVVQEHPYMTCSNQLGEVAISQIPIGKHCFYVWHETIGKLDSTNTVNSLGDPVAWDKQKAIFEIREGKNDLGTFKVTLPELK